MARRSARDRRRDASQAGDALNGARARSAGIILLVVLALVLIVTLRERSDAGGPGASRVEGAREHTAPAEPEAPSEAPPTVDEARAPNPSSVEPSAPQVAPRAPARVEVEVDPCAEPERIERHDRLDALVNARISELRDRARIALDDEATSDGLRAALTAVLVRGETSLASVEPAVAAPDRIADGFDLATSLYLTVAVRLDARDPRNAELAIDRAARLAPRDAVPHVLRAIRRIHAREMAGFREALGEAFARDREEPAIAIELAYALSRTVELARTIDALSAYLAVYPGDPEALHLRARTERRRDGVGQGARTRAARGVTILYASDVSEPHVVDALDTIVGALDDASRALALPRRAELAVLVHRDHDAMLRAMCGQSWTAAAYDGVLHLDRSLFDPQQTTDAMRRGVLRHETLHAALHDRPRDVPYWADEGIAQHFAGLDDPSASRDFARLVRDRTYVPLASLDGAFLDIDDPADARLAYHQSLAMIDWLVAQRGERGIAELVARLETTAAGSARDPSTILSEVAGRRFDGEVLLAFLATR